MAAPVRTERRALTRGHLRCYSNSSLGFLSLGFLVGMIIYLYIAQRGILHDDAVSCRKDLDTV